EVAAAYGASKRTIAVVEAFLERFGAVGNVDVTRTFVHTSLDPDQATAIFGPDPATEPQVPFALRDSVTAILIGDPSDDHSTSDLPAAADGDAEGILPPWPESFMTSGTPEPCPSPDPSDCVTQFSIPPEGDFRMLTPVQLRTAYGISATGLAGQGTTVVLLQFGQVVDPVGIDAYTSAFGLPRANLNQVDLSGQATAPGREATLDVSMVVALAPEADVTLLNVAPLLGDLFTGVNPLAFSAALDKRNTAGRLADVVSVSYGNCEAAIPAPRALLLLTEPVLLTAGAAGVTFITSSGDNGSTDCISYPGADSSLAVQYPASSPWVTTVGGTTIELEEDNSIGDLEAWNNWPLLLDPDACDSPPCRPLPFAGGGGDSAWFPRPWWQIGPGVERTHARQLPDVAVYAGCYPGFQIAVLISDSRVEKTGCGTSQSAPSFAAMIAILNQAAAQRGQPRLGFASPLLYALGRHPWAPYFDVVEGDNIIGDQNARFPVDCCHATDGYDRATGWGSLLLDEAIDLLADGSVIPRHPWWLRHHRRHPRWR
ncbi:MAG: S53 family peptidase, partial [Pseudomonadota bacterium]